MGRQESGHESHKPERCRRDENRRRVVGVQPKKKLPHELREPERRDDAS